MKKIKGFYKVLDRFVMSGAWENLSNQRVIAVEIPKSKEMYYVTVDLRDIKESIFNIDVVKGNLGLLSLREAFDPKAKVMDKVKRSDFINVSFQNTRESLPEAYFDAFDSDYVYEGFDNVGFPFIFYKAKGHVSQPLDEALRSDLAYVFEALITQDFGRIKKLKINKKTKIKTFYKTDETWQLEERLHQLNYPKVKYSDLEVYPLLKQSEKINETWHMLSIYEYMVADEDSVENLKVPAFNGTAYLLDSKEDVLSYKEFVGANGEIPAIKKALCDALRGFKIRPTTVVTNLRSLYYGFKDFMAALEIALIYEPSDEIIADFTEYILYNETFEDDVPVDDLFSKDALIHYLEMKGISLEDFYKLSEKEVEALMDEFGQIIKELVDSFQSLLEAAEKEKENLSAEEMSKVIEDFFIKGIDEKVTF